MQATRNAATSYIRNPMISAFAARPPSPGSGGPVVVPGGGGAAVGFLGVRSTWAAAVPRVSRVCIPSSSGRGAATLSYAGGVGESTLTTSAPQSRAHGRVDAPSLSRFSRGDGGPTFDDAFGLDLHLSLAPAAP
ncbi:hypothetical protein CK203_088471 [Vitis vinifera]|uniref:Uncharacterized protein n=1 Tax=Vitis vinifera TaxID=29760 RepID=A0A438ELE0_VITVI|nr:hypothetical protein CK203_088471 [Vitis vinifera]